MSRSRVPPNLLDSKSEESGDDAPSLPALYPHGVCIAV